MERRMNNHVDTVLQTEIKKQSNQDKLEDINSEKYKKWLSEKEERERTARKNGLLEMKSKNLEQIGQHEQRRTEDKNLLNQIVSQRHHEERELKDFEKEQKMIDRNYREIYKETLD